MRALILAAGKGTRMRSEKAKVLHAVMGQPMLGRVLDTLEACGIREMAVVVGAYGDQVQAYLRKRAEKGSASVKIIWQKEQRGTGHAVLTAKSFFKNTREDLLVWPGDMPLFREQTLRDFIREHHACKSVASVLSALVVDPTGYGRILRSGGSFFAIREELDASESEKRIQEINTGIYLFKAERLIQALRKLQPSNAKKELYLTDTIEWFAKEEEEVRAFPLAVGREAEGINSREQLAQAMKTANQREIEKHMAQGVTVVAPQQCYIEAKVRIGQDTVIYPWCYIESGVIIGKNCQIGPFAKIRKGTRIGDDSIIGSFVEVNRSKLGRKVYAKHLSYLGDAVLGDETNVGAGTITANYDGKNKHQTIIGKRVAIGSNTVLVAPVRIEDQAKTGAGCVVLGGSIIKKGATVAGVPARLVSKKKRNHG